MSKKRCCNCLVTKPLSEFHKDKHSHDGSGFSYLCKMCKSDRLKQRYRTRKGFALVMYQNQKESSKKRGHLPPKYTASELFDWLNAQPLFHKLYQEWEGSGYDRNLSPSVDRISDSEGYSFNNIQLMTWAENRDKGHEHRRTGLNNKRSTAVIQMDMDGMFIQEHHSMSDASRKTGVNYSSIWSCCNKMGYKSSFGFTWKYKNTTEANKFSHTRKSKFDET